MNRLVCLVVLMLAAAAPAARAQCGHTHVVTGSFGPQNAFWSGRQITLPRFQPGAGQTLVKATITVDATVDATWEYENRSTLDGCTASLNSAASFTVQCPGLADIVITPSSTTKLHLAVFDGVLDFGGSSGVTLSTVPASAQRLVEVTDLGQLASLFSGPGAVVFTHRASDASTRQGCSPVTFCYGTQGSLRVTVTYESCAPDTPFCDGSDGAHAFCPCNNAGSPGAGCDIAQGTGGVALHAAAQDTVLMTATLHGTGYPPLRGPTALVLRSNTLDPAAPVVFGDGLRCVNAAFTRLSATFAAGGTSTHALGHEPAAGSGTFYYQVWFRNQPETFCDPLSAFNISGGRTLVWP